MNSRWLLAAVAALALAPPAFGQKKDKEKKELRWGTDPTGGAPYVYKDDKGNFVGFEVELAEYLAKETRPHERDGHRRLGQVARTARQAGR